MKNTILTAFTAILLTVFITLKLTGVISWSWWLVCSPFLIPLSMCGMCMLYVFSLFRCAYILQGKAAMSQEIGNYSSLIFFILSSFVLLALFCTTLLLKPYDKAEVCFTPGGFCTDKLINVINKEPKEILVQAYSFTSTSIIDALLHAKQRGVDVKIILDKGQKNNKQLRALIQAGIPICIDYKVRIAHNKIMIFSDSVETGSFNYSKSAQYNNAENMVFLPFEVRKEFLDNWDKRFLLCDGI